MTYELNIVCFANSRKTSARCIAGKIIDVGNPGIWIRPISYRSTHEISESARMYAGNLEPQILDILTVSFIEPRPSSHQKENHLINSRFKWFKLGHILWTDLSIWSDTPPQLWATGNSSYSGKNNRVTIGEENGESLYLIHAKKIRLLVGKKSNYSDAKRNVRAYFRYSNIEYLMDVGVCQHSCRMNHAIASFKTVGLTGFSATGPTGSQLRVFLPFQRSG